MNLDFSDFNAQILVTFTKPGNEKSKLKSEVLVRKKNKTAIKYFKFL